MKRTCVRAILRKAQLGVPTDAARRGERRLFYKPRGSPDSRGAKQGVKMTAAQLRSLPVNLRNRFGREILAEIEAMNPKEEDEIDLMIKAADSHVSVVKVREVALLN